MRVLFLMVLPQWWQQPALWLAAMSGWSSERLYGGRLSVRRGRIVQQHHEKITYPSVLFLDAPNKNLTGWADQKSVYCDIWNPPKKCMFPRFYLGFKKNFGSAGGVSDLVARAAVRDCGGA